MSSAKRVLVTGPAGVIGRQLTADLLASGHEVLGIDRDTMLERDLSALRYEQDDLTEMVEAV